jgi:SAM-dependent methyltransferase
MAGQPVNGQSLDERVLESAVGALEMFGVYLGRKLGLYERLAAGPLTSQQLAVKAGIDERYAREWLEQQAVAGYLGVSESSGQRTFELDSEQEAVLVAADRPEHVSPLASLVVGIGQVLDRVVDAYRAGTGVPYADYGEDFRNGQGDINRPAFTHDLVSSWIPAMGDVHERLAEGSDRRIAELGCGQGWAAVALAKAYPKTDVVGLDADTASIEDARARAAAAGARVRFEADDAESIARHGSFDLVLMLETLHDLARPIEVLTAARRVLVPGGVVLVADEAVADSFTAPGELLERMMYGWSITHCLPSSRHTPGSAALGTVLRAPKVRELAAQAGLNSFDVLDVDGGFFRLYRLGE